MPGPALASRTPNILGFPPILFSSPAAGGFSLCIPLETSAGGTRGGVVGPISRDSPFAKAISSLNAGFGRRLRPVPSPGRAVSSDQLMSGYSSYEEIQDLHTRARVHTQIALKT